MWKGGTMITIKGYGLVNRIAFYVMESFFWAFNLWFLGVVLLIHPHPVFILFLLFTTLVHGVGTFWTWRTFRRTAVQAILVNDRIHFTMIMGNVRVIDPDRIVRVIQWTHGYRIIDDQRNSIFMNFLFWPKTPYNPWKPLMKPLHFQNAEFKDQLYYF
jgi:hypothetical protein